MLTALAIVTSGRTKETVADALPLGVKLFVSEAVFVTDDPLALESTEAVRLTLPAEFAGSVPRLKVTVWPDCATPVSVAEPVAVIPPLGAAANVTVGLAHEEPLFVTTTDETAPAEM